METRDTTLSPCLQESWTQIVASTHGGTDTAAIQVTDLGSGQLADQCSLLQIPMPFASAFAHWLMSSCERHQLMCSQVYSSIIQCIAREYHHCARTQRTAMARCFAWYWNESEKKNMTWQSASVLSSDGGRVNILKKSSDATA